MNRELKSYVSRKLKTTTIFWLIVLVVATAFMNYRRNVFLPSHIVSADSIQSKGEVPICSVLMEGKPAMEEKKISITFDTAWGNESTETLLEVLAAQNVKATFFLAGGWAAAYPEDVKAIFASGHELANHGENHKSMSLLSAEEQKAEIMKLHHKIKALTGYEMNLFRPPYEDYNVSLLQTAREAGYHTVQWNVDSLDWKEYGTDEIVLEVLKHEQLRSGSIIRFHNDAKYTTAAVERLLIELKEQGYELVKISDLIYPENYYIDEEGKQIFNQK